MSALYWLTCRSALCAEFGCGSDSVEAVDSDKVGASDVHDTVVASAVLEAVVVSPAFFVAAVAAASAWRVDFALLRTR